MIGRHVPSGSGSSTKSSSYLGGANDTDKNKSCETRKERKKTWKIVLSNPPAPSTRPLSQTWSALCHVLGVVLAVFVVSCVAGIAVTVIAVAVVAVVAVILFAWVFPLGLSGRGHVPIVPGTNSERQPPITHQANGRSGPRTVVRIESRDKRRGSVGRGDERRARRPGREMTATSSPQGE